MEISPFRHSLYHRYDLLVARLCTYVGSWCTLWSCLGLPLLVFLTVPSNTAPDPLGDHTRQVKQGAAGGILDAQTQCEVVRNLVRLFISKQAVQGVIWNQLDDSKPHDFPHGGLVDGHGRIKPVMDVLAKIRERNLI